MRPVWQAALLLILWVAPVADAWAHASLIEAVPADGATLDRPPAGIELRFDEPVTALSLTLSGPAGPVPLPGPIDAAGGSLRARLPPALAGGTYLLSWRVISADGHPVGGTLAFGIGTAPERGVAQIGPDPGWSRAAGVLRFLLNLGFAIGAGGALFRALVAEPSARLRSGMAAAALAGSLVALGGIGVAGGSVRDAAFPGALLDPATWQAATASTAMGRGLVVAAGLAVVALSLSGTGRARVALGLAGALAAAIGLSLSGHAAIGGWPVQALLALHALAAAFWLGAFWPLLALLAERGGKAAPVVRRFGMLAIPFVALLVLTGGVQAALHLGSWHALVATTYGQLVLAKVIGAALLLLLAAANHLWLTPALATGGAIRLSRSIRTESGIAVILLGITAVLGMTPPHAAAPRHEGHGHAAAQPRMVATQASGLDLALEVEPAVIGTNRLTLFLARGDAPVVSPEVWLDLSQPEAGILGVRRAMRAEAAGRYAYQGPELAVAGRWTARVEVLVSDFEQVAANLGFDIAPR